MIDYLNDWVVRGLATGFAAGGGVILENYFVLRPRISQLRKEVTEVMGKLVFLQSKLEDEAKERNKSERELYAYIDRAIQSTKQEQEARINRLEENMNKRIEQVDNEVKDVRQDVRTGFHNTSNQISGLHNTLITLLGSMRDEMQSKG